MNTDKFLKKYGQNKCNFHNAYKNSFTYLDANKKFKINGLAEYKSHFDAAMTVNEFYENVDEFSFVFLNTILQ